MHSSLKNKKQKPSPPPPPQSWFSYNWTEMMGLNWFRFLYCLTGSTLRGLRTVQFWTVQRSAAQNVTRIYTGYVANLPNKEDILTWNSRKCDKCGCMPLFGQKFPIKTLWKKSFVLFGKLSSTQDWKKGRKIPGMSALWNTPAMIWKYHRLTDKSCPRMRKMTSKLLSALYIFLTQR